MNKYQFYISFNNKPGTASSKAIDDCTTILSSLGYENYNLTTKLTSRFYLLSIFGAVLKLLYCVRPNTILAIQYPLLSGNRLFSYVIRLLHIRKVRVLGIVHDLNDLRYQSPDPGRRSDAILLNDYDAVIVHNQAMISWLRNKGVTSSLFSLEIFDYLSDHPSPLPAAVQPFPRTIVFAGNLAKSTFIYDLDSIRDWQFNLYGPNIERSKLVEKKNVHWRGVLSAEDILVDMEGAYGLIWDGNDLVSLDENYGNYLRYNNPHKLSLYLAAGLPVIVPGDSAVAAFVSANQIGIILNNLQELTGMEISAEQYALYQRNVYRIGNLIQKGFYLKKAIEEAEHDLNKNL